LQKLDLEKVIAFPDFFPYCNEISTSNEIRLLPPQQIHVDDVAFLGFGFGFSVRVQSWSEKIQSSPVRRIIENHQAGPVLICPR